MVDLYAKIKVLKIPEIYEIQAILIPGKQVATKIIPTNFGILLGFDDRSVDVLKWSSIDNAEYQAKLSFYS